MAETSNASQSQVDINQIATDLNGKADRDLANTSVPTVISRTTNSSGGIVEIWSDGYCVQTGIVDIPQYTTYSSVTISLTQAYKDNSFLVFTQMYAGNTYWSIENNMINSSNKTVNAFTIELYQVTGGGTTINAHKRFFRTEGYIR